MTATSHLLSSSGDGRPVTVVLASDVEETLPVETWRRIHIPSSRPGPRPRFCPSRMLSLRCRPSRPSWAGGPRIYRVSRCRWPARRAEAVPAAGSTSAALRIILFVGEIPNCCPPRERGDRCSRMFVHLATHCLETLCLRMWGKYSAIKRQ